MRGITQRQWLLAISSGVLQVLIFPSPSLFVLAWVALVPLILAILPVRENGGKIIDPQGRVLAPTTGWQGFWLGYVSGFLWYLGSCHWVFFVMHVYGGLNTPVALGVLLLFCFYLSLYNGLFGALLALAAKKPAHGLRNALLLIPFLWVAVELARTRITGFPWDLLGTAQVDNIPLTRLATITGVYGVSFIIALVNAGISAAYLTPAHARRRLLPVAFAIAVMLQLGTLVSFKPFPTTQQALLVQHNIALNDNWTLPQFNQTLTDLKKLSVIPATQKPGSIRLVVWPESPAPFFDNDPNFRSAISDLAHNQNAYVVAGVVGTLASRTPSGEPDLANRAVLVTPKGDFIGRYDKIHLVPFGEYIPFQSFFVFASKLTREIGNFKPGSVRTVFNAGDKLGVFICYESIFPDEIRQFANNGAGVFINISNDGWYGEHGAPGQHLNMARMRAIENFRWILRDTNTGVTASIDPYGRLAARAPRQERVSLLAPFNTVSRTTFYTRYGDWFAWACAIISFIGIFVRFRFRKAALST